LFDRITGAKRIEHRINVRLDARLEGIASYLGVDRRADDVSAPAERLKRVINSRNAGWLTLSSRLVFLRVLVSSWLELSNKIPLRLKDTKKHPESCPKSKK
jgi:hypothetical protein